MKTRVYRALFPFGGAGAGALGFLQARMKVMGVEARFKSIGGIDFDAEACKDFRYLTRSPAWCTDIGRLTAADILRRYGMVAPDVVFMSPPCKGASGLLSEAKSKTAKYSEMNELALAWTRLMLGAWADRPPRLVILENVPRLKKRAAPMLKKLRALLKAAGYVLTDGYHDCGELGGLAQHRRRYLLVARHAKQVPPLLYQPPKRRVRACGEVLEQLPMPGDPAAGPMHKMPNISWLNWVRLALIPAGGDWRDLPGVIAEGEERRSKFKRHRVERYDAPTGTVGGSGSNAVANVADPRPGIALGDNPSRHWNKYAVNDWNDPAHTVTGAVQPGSGGPAVADPRAGGFGHCDRVTGWDEATGTVTTSPAPSSGAIAVADPRWGGGRLGVLPMDAPAGTISGESLPTNGPFSVADNRVAGPGDPRAGAWFRGRYGVQDWKDPSKTVTAGNHCDGADFVADPRLSLNLGPDTHTNVYRVGDWNDPAGAVTGATRPGAGAAAVADPRGWFHNVLKVVPFDEPAGTVTGQGRPTCGGLNVSDPRGPSWGGGRLGVKAFDDPGATVTGNARPSTGAFSVADPMLRPKAAFDHAYGVLRADEVSPTVAGKSLPGQGAYSIADARWDGSVALGCEPRNGVLGVIPWTEAMKTVTGNARVDNGAFAVCDPRIPDAPPLMVIRDVRKPPPAVPIILAEDGTWHRPLTTLELAALQGFPLTVRGKPLKLSGTSSSAWRERIGNAVPPPAARAIAERMLTALLQADLEAFVLTGDGDVWVAPDAVERAA
jgi:site-specific DNA-cytosine methylase